MNKIKSGVFGLDSLLDGGLNENSTTVVIGCSGAGKTTIANQFIRRGLEEGVEGIFVSLDENKEQVIREAIEMGWTDITHYLDEELLVFIDASGKEFSTFIKKELPSFVSEWSGANARIAIDPLTPVLWATKDMYEQRDLIGFLLKQTRKIGTVLCTLEEHGAMGTLSGFETVIPMYLADCVIHLRYNPLGGPSTRQLKIIKCRSSRHSPFYHSYKTIKGFGIVVQRGSYKIDTGMKVPEFLKTEFNKLETPATKIVFDRFRAALDQLTDEDFRDIDPRELARDIADEYLGFDRLPRRTTVSGERGRAG